MIRNTRVILPSVLLLIPVLLFGEGKSPTKAMLLSLLPGGGQFYNEEYIKGILFATVQTVCLGSTLREHIYAMDAKREGRQADYNFHIEKRYDWLWWSFGAWAFSMGDAYVGAHFYNFHEKVGIELEVGFRF
ncbi:hypothetical protein CH333_10445 [candidate division WOR-3 bacterium JGI_Cruoil_03_44_89]|uniref:DUF5683 domain-containing protein n=1 Tax=candidate division WOR-3 bacterium JGI_Cruoil_03_44_89 TaxID=1973748 RepID=A0A235BQ38_UNCW3|nr:MAG: hypothetical protein CH333_10445 [candidate division WOR-3 bacterium JGI_Cruoil_03_44_89]